MRPEEFGPFLAQQRKAAGMTQGDLAEKLHVSAAAVSKWERGKCLPELGKLEDIAGIFGITVLDVMQCRIEPRRTAEESARQTYAQTLSLSRSQSRRRWAKGIGLVAVVLGLWLGSRVFPLHRIVQVWQPSYFETGEISLLAYTGSREDREIAREVLDRAEAAFRDIQVPRGQEEALYGPLGRYATEASRGGVREEHSLELWSAHFHLTDGTMWVYYSQEIFDGDGETVRGSWRIPSLWYLEKDENGIWQVTGIKEHP